MRAERRQIRVEETERVRWLDHAHAGGALLLHDLVAEGLHSCPVHLRAEMVLGMVAVVEPDPVVKPVVATYAPGDRLVRVTAVVPVVAIEVGETVAEVPEGKEEQDVMPVQDTKRDKGAHKQDQLGDSPESLAAVFALQ